jgi:hypothetical protein
MRIVLIFHGAIDLDRGGVELDQLLQRPCQGRQRLRMGLAGSFARAKTLQAGLMGTHLCLRRLPETLDKFCTAGPLQRAFGRKLNSVVHQLSPRTPKAASACSAVAAPSHNS